MKTINLSNQVESEVAYEITHFPDGESQIVIKDALNHKEEYQVLCRITCDQELIILCQLGDILDRHKIIWDLSISYLMSMRMDRIIDFNRPFSLLVVSKILSILNYRKCIILEPHSNASTRLIPRSFEKRFGFSTYINPTDCVVFPDKGAADKYQYLRRSNSYIICQKVRDIDTGKIVDFIVAESSFKPQDINRYVIIDDLCDGGTTLLKTKEVILSSTENKPIDVIVPHLVNPKGMMNLQCAFHHVITTNSYRQWESKDNVTVLNVWENF